MKSRRASEAPLFGCWLPIAWISLAPASAQESSALGLARHSDIESTLLFARKGGKLCSLGS